MSETRATRNSFALRFARRITVCALVLLTLFLGGFSVLALQAFENAFVPEMHKKADLVGDQIVQDVEKALSYGIGLTELVGMESYLSGFTDGNPDILAIQVRDQKGRVLFSSLLDQPLPSQYQAVTLQQEGHHAGDVRVFWDPMYIEALTSNVIYDQITALLITLLIAFELLNFFIHGRVLGPLSLVERVLKHGVMGDFTRTVHSRAIRELEGVEERLNGFLYRLADSKRDVIDNAQEIKAAQINPTYVRHIKSLIEKIKERVRTGTPYAFQDMADENIRIIRFPLFLFMFAEELSRSFLPLLAQEYEQVSWLAGHENLAAGLPIAIFMAMIVVISLISGHWIEKWGGKKLFLIGVVPALLGYIGVYFAPDYVSFLAARSLSAVGYAIVFVACQGYVAGHSTAKTRAANMAVFVGGVLVAGICGPAIGGILASQIGYEQTFIISAVFVCIATAIVMLMLQTEDLEKYQVSGKQQTRLSWHIFSEPRFTLVSVFCAIPSKIILTGIIYLLTPLYLIDLAASEATIGRVIMIYGVLVVFVMPRVSAWADKQGRHLTMVLLGGVLAGMGGMCFFVSDGLWAMVAAVSLIGLGQACSMPTQLAYVQQIFSTDKASFSIASALGVFRSVERIGSVVGPLLAGTLALHLGTQQAIAVLGTVGAVGVVGYMCCHILFFRRRA